MYKQNITASYINRLPVAIATYYNVSFYSKQLLEMAGLKEEYEDVLWSYLNTTVRQTVTDYQVDTKEKNMLTSSPDHTPFTADEVGKLLVKAVEGLKPTQVQKIHIMFLVWQA